MEKYEYISKLLNELIINGFFVKKEEIKQKNLQLTDFINEKAYNEKFPDIKVYKVICGGNSDICGFYALFYTLNYLKYLFNGRDIYYLYRNTIRKSFFKFYKKFLSFFISNMTSLEQYEIEELNKQSSLERHHLDFILKNNLLFKYMGEKYNSLHEKFKFEFEWFDFMSNNFATSDISKIEKLNNIFKEIRECTKTPDIQNKIFFLYVGLTEHWILIIYDSLYKNICIEMDSYEGSQDIINLKYLDDNEINAYIKNINDQITKIKKKPLTEYSSMQFKNSILDMHRFLYKLNNLILKNNDFNLGISIMEERCNSFMESFNCLKISQDDKLNGLLVIYNWLANEYHPKRIKEDFYDMMNELKINKNCENENIKKFFRLIKTYRDFMNENIKLIEQQDIKELLEKGLNVFDEINKKYID